MENLRALIFPRTLVCPKALGGRDPIFWCYADTAVIFIYYLLLILWVEVAGTIGSHSNFAAPSRVPVALASSMSEIW